MELKVAICGANGFIGNELLHFYSKMGLSVEKISRQALREKDTLDAITGSSAVLINVAGEPVIGRWTKAKRKKLKDSRIGVTGRLTDSMLRVNSPPELFIQASAIGIYRENCSEMFTEESGRYSEGFLGGLVKDWENEAWRASKGNIRTVLLRMGLVLGKNGGFMKKVLPLFNIGIGTSFNRGEKSMSYIYLKELIRIIEFVRMNREIDGVVNVTHDRIITFDQFFKQLSVSTGKPLIFNIPDFMIRLAFGKAAISLLSGHRIYPAKLLKHGYSFQYDSIQSILDEICHK